MIGIWPTARAYIAKVCLGFAKLDQAAGLFGFAWSQRARARSLAC